MDVQQLVERLEKATEGDWELDKLIYELVNFPTEWRGFKIVQQWTCANGTYGFKTEDGTRYANCISAPRYTTSIDAALTLVPDGLKWSVGTWSDNFAKVGPEGFGPAKFSAENNPTPALALCIAALKAQADGERT